MIKLHNKKIFFWVIGMVLSSACLSGTAFAAIPTTFSAEEQNNALINARNKVMYNIISDCYNSLSGNINVTSGYTTWSQIFNNGNAKHNIPYYLFDNSTVSSSPKLTCSEIMGGWKNFWGTQTFSGIGYRESDVPVPDGSGNFGSKEEMVSFLEKIGYTPTEDSANEVEGYRCVSYSGTTPSGKAYATDKVCAKQSSTNENEVDLNYAIKVDSVSSDDLGGGNLDTIIFKIKSVNYSNGTLTIPKVGYDTWLFLTTGAQHANIDNYASCTETYVPTPIVWESGANYSTCYSYGFLGLSTGRLRVSNIKSMTFDDLARALGTALLTAKEAEPNNFPSFSSQAALVENATIDPAVATVLKKGSFEDYMKYFMGTNYAQYGESLTETEKYMLYWSGLKEVVTANSGAPNGNVEYWLVGTEFKNDYNLVCSSGCNITTLNRNGKLETLKAISGSNPTVLQLLNELDYESSDFGEVTVPEEDVYDNNTSDGTGSSGGSSDDACGSSGGAGSLGWIVCPLLEWMGKASEELYENSIKPSLEIQPMLFTQGSDGGTKGAWKTFQGIANLVFIVLLLLVIFSQLTGVGIDNYGIKKILPKLIVAAVLVNLSYYICLILVDVSNIVGNSVQSLFDGLSADVTVDAEFQGNVSGAGATIASVGLIAAAAGTATWIIWSNPATVLSLLVAALGIGIAIFFLFILLATREAAVVVLTVLSPLAFACYMLPNTKRYFDKWKQIFQGLLLVYPICGLLVSGGNYVSRLLLSSGFAAEGIVKAITAMVVGIIPIFFIPTVLKGSFSALGNLGAKISGFGNRFRGGTDKLIRNSTGYKNAQERGLERNTRIRAGLDKNGQPVKMGKFGQFMRGGKRNVARQRSQYLKDQDTRIREDNLMGTGFEAGLADVRAKADESKVAAYGSLLDLGEATTENGTVVNTNNAETVGTYHAEAMARYQAAVEKGNAKAATEAMAQIKAAQNVLSKTDKGRAQVQTNFENAVNSGKTAALPSAAAHIMGAYGDRYKSVNRGAHSMISDLSSGGVEMSKIKKRIANQTYMKAGTDKYTEESLAGADDKAIENLRNSMGSMSETERGDIKATAERALQKRDSGNLNIKPEVAKQLEEIASWSPAASAAVQGSAGGSASSTTLNLRGNGAGGSTQTIDVRDLRELGDETLLDIATNPRVQMEDATRTAAEQEYLRRNPPANPPANPPRQG